MQWGPRTCVVLRGASGETAPQAVSLLRHVPPGSVLWVDDDDGTPALGDRVAPRGTFRRLGRGYDAVVVNLHHALNLDVLAAAQGFVWGGGCMVLRMPPMGQAPTGGDEALAVFPFSPADVTHHCWTRLERLLVPPHVVVHPDAAWPAPPPHLPRGTAQQDVVVDALAAAMTKDGAALVTLTADRGRGKSAALGLAWARARQRKPGLAGVLVVPQGDAAAPVLAFAGEGLTVLTAEQAMEQDTAAPVVLVDEAASVPVPWLQHWAHRGRCVVFSTTVAGYEGSGRGFLLRFKRWCDAQPQALALELQEPIRFGSGDPLEALWNRALVLGAQPAPPVTSDFSPDAATVEQLDRGALSRDEGLLQDVFGLLVHSHYRTTPSDLHRALDAPNLALHAVLWRGRAVAVCLVAREGGLTPAQCEQLWRGETRIRGHALADTLVSHAALPQAGTLQLLRSVRIAVHPQLRRRGLARRLVEHVHAHHHVDAFGTVFGATPELLRFRQALGYRLCRLGVSRGGRSGEPAAVMVRPVSPQAHGVVEELQRRLALGLEEQLALQQAGVVTRVEAPLAAAVRQLVPPVATSDVREALETVRRYLQGVQPVEVVAWAVRAVLAQHPGVLATLPAGQRALLESRVWQRLDWNETARRAGFDAAPRAQRAMRAAVAALLQALP